MDLNEAVIGFQKSQSPEGSEADFHRVLWGMQTHQAQNVAIPRRV